MSKYGAIRHEEDGFAFASGAELRRYRELRLLERAGAISGLEVHPAPYALVVNGVKIGRYTADFRYVEDGQLVVEDVKNSATAKARDYPLRKKLMLALHGISIREVTA